MEYKEGYYVLFEKITETIEYLQEIQKEAEKICIEQDSEEK